MEQPKVKGTFYAVSIGPGDPELMTLQAVRLLRCVPVVAAPVNPTGKSVALEIASAAVNLGGKKILRLQTAMSMDKKTLSAAHVRQAEQVMKCLDDGEDVAMLTLGDVSVYSTACYVAELLKQRGYSTVMLPGVTSFCAAASALNISLTEMDTPIHIIPASSMDVREAMKLSGTKILMKPGSYLPEVLSAIEENGENQHAYLAANCGMQNELLCENIRELKELPGYYTTIIVKNGEKK